MELTQDATITVSPEQLQKVHDAYNIIAQECTDYDAEHPIPTCRIDLLHSFDLHSTLLEIFYVSVTEGPPDLLHIWTRNLPDNHEIIALLVICDTEPVFSFTNPDR